MRERPSVSSRLHHAQQMLTAHDRGDIILTPDTAAELRRVVENLQAKEQATKEPSE